MSCCSRLEERLQVCVRSSPSRPWTHTTRWIPSSNSSSSSSGGKYGKSEARSGRSLYQPAWKLSCFSSSSLAL